MADYLPKNKNRSKEYFKAAINRNYVFDVIGITNMASKVQEHNRKT